LYAQSARSLYSSPLDPLAGFGEVRFGKEEKGKKGKGRGKDGKKKNRKG